MTPGVAEAKVHIAHKVSRGPKEGSEEILLAFAVIPCATTFSSSSLWRLHAAKETILEASRCTSSSMWWATEPVYLL